MHVYIVNVFIFQIFQVQIVYFMESWEMWHIYPGQTHKNNTNLLIYQMTYFQLIINKPYHYLELF